MMETFYRVGEWLNSFFGAVCMAVFAFFALLSNINANSVGMAWVMGFVTLYWLYVARRALKIKGATEYDVPLTDDQKQMIKEAAEQFDATLKEIALELEQAAREKANVQSDKRENQEAGKEGIDRRTDSKEDRTP